MSDEGFISLGRNAELDGGSAGYGPTGGAFATGGGPLGGDGGTGGSVISVGGTAGDANGGTSTSGTGGTSTNGTGGTSTSGEGNTCGSGGMPLVPEPNSGGAALFEACGEAGPNQRICLEDGTVFFCGVTQFPVEQCAPGTCETGCCHATSDPCPIADPLALPNYDCAGDCGGNGSCTEATTAQLTLVGNDMQIVRLGVTNLGESGCGRYFQMLVITRPEAPARVTVSPPWKLSRGCPGPADGQCLMTEPGNFETVFISSDVEAPPPRNVVFEMNDEILGCPP